MPSLSTRLVAILLWTLTSSQIVLAMPTHSERRQSEAVPPYVLSYGTLSALGTQRQAG